MTKTPLLAFACVALLGCKKGNESSNPPESEAEQEMEQAGEEIEDAAEQTGDAVEDAADEVEDSLD